MPVSVVGVNISKTGNYTILITVSRPSAFHTLLKFINNHLTIHLKTHGLLTRHISQEQIVV
ncbi:hypothetical protein C2C36_22595 [Escherichia coli]|nr:hypothetical protein [Escherichia coli]